MTQTVLQKTDFIKFNVSPTFKALVAKKAKSTGLTLSELGRMLFGAYVFGLIDRPYREFEKQAGKARENYKKGKGKTFKSAQDAIEHLESL
jgi:hypothetical protein